jgi:hypothetical protein
VAAGKRKPGVTSAKAKPKRSAKAAQAQGQSRPTTKQMERAGALAQRMPLVHYPASDAFEDWADGPKRWSALQSNAARNALYAKTPFGALRGEHVFVYAGPSCYFRRDSTGNALLYFEPSADVGHTGGASPFDSGSLEPGSTADPRPKLQPWRAVGAGPDECWTIFERYRRELDGWRDDFARWLVNSYDDPDRYLETIPDRYAAGQPERLDPSEILEHNGTKGYARYEGDCADRRAWTWEVRIARELSWQAVRAVHVPFSLLRIARAWAREVESVHGNRPGVKALPRNELADFDTLYTASGSTLREMVGS